MNAVGPSEHELAQLRPRDVAGYLSSRGWTQGARVRYSRRWELEQGGLRHRLLLPLDIGLADYADRMADLIGSLAAVESRPPSAVHQDLTLTGLDVLRIRTMPHTPSGTIPVHDGVLAVTSARDLLLAAACDTVADEHRVVLPGRKPQRAKDFVSSARFGPSSPGSYVFTVHVPLPDATSDGSLFEDTPELDVAPEPFARQVSRRLYESVTVAHTAAVRAEAADDSAPFAIGLEHGVSADLCEALAGIGGNDGRDTSAGYGFSVGFGWSPRWPVPYENPVTVFPRRLVPVLRAGAQDLRRQEPDWGVTIVGRPIRLKRVGDFGPGEVTVEGRLLKENGDLVGQQRQINIQLSEEDYIRATDAHRDRRDLKVEGDLSRRGNYHELTNVTAFDVLS
jgi:hypothetical protein